jgi:mRNA interferase RelE/StbE
VRYSIAFNKKTGKQLRTIPLEYLPKIISKIDALADDPRPRGVRKLSGRIHTYRVRQGDYRIIYQIQDQSQRVIILSISDRKDAY